MSEQIMKRCASPAGELRLIGTRTALVGVYFADHRPSPGPSAREVDSHPILDRAARELAEYFEGARRAFDVPLEAGGSEFERAVWRALAEIPYGETRSYGDLARRLGRPGAARAVGRANGSNPLSIVVPCHRVLGVHGALTGYAGGTSVKRWLLDHERGHRPARLTPTT